MKSKTTIELNGRHYDALTGTMLGVASAPSLKPARNIDGFFRGRTQPSGASAPHKPAASNTVNNHAQPHAERDGNHITAHKPHPAKTAPDRHSQSVSVQSTPAHKIAVHRSASHTQPHKPQPAVTLMRSAVARPGASFKKQTHVQGSLQHQVPSLVAKRSAHAIDEERLARAQAAAQSPQIVHHGAPLPSYVAVNIAPLPVQPQPKTGTDVPPAPAPQPTNKSLDMFEHAIANATHFVDVKAHRAHFKKQARKHVLSLSAGTLVLLAIAGFAAYQNMPSLQLKVASVKAGVPTSMPNLKAAGFTYNGTQADNGKLTVGFSSEQGQYQLVQQTTNWDTNDMIQNIGSVEASGYPSYTTLKVGNTTVYRFNITNATWVTNGKWYSVSGNSSLTDAQIAAIVKNTH